MEQQAQSALPRTTYNPNWRKWHEAGFTEWLLPIGPVGAKLSPNSKIDPSQVGKIPMVYLKDRGHWSGYVGWTKHKHTEEQVRMFSRWAAGVGLNAAVFNGGDVDVEDAELAEAIVQAAIRRLGPTAVRYRDGSARRLLMYQTGDDIHKKRLAWRNNGVDEAFEWLGTGQQFVCDAVHKSGEPYKWFDPHPCDLGVYNIPTVTHEQVRALFDDVRDLIVKRGHEFVTRKEGSSTSAKRKPLSDASLHAPSPQHVLDVLAAVPCNDETFPARDDFVRTLAAIKAALGADADEHWPAVLDWAMHYPGAEPDYIEKIWASIKDAAVGWDYLSAWARGHGYNGGAQTDFDEASPAWARKTAHPLANLIKASPFTWQEPKSIPRREWLYGRHFIRKYLSTTVAPGGVGKSALLTVEILAMVTGKNLLGELPASPLRVWYWNGEDPPDDLQRRFAAACLHYGISPEDIGDRLFVNSGRETTIVIAQDDKSGLKIAHPVIEALRKEIIAKKIDVLIIDPFVSSHGVSENDNVKINAVLREWAMLADATGCAIELAHHTRKPAFGQAAEYSVDDARGAGAMIAAVRSARTLNLMTKEEAGKLGIGEDRRRSFFRVDNGKSNLAPPAERSTWRRHISVPLGNGGSGTHPGDSVGVVTAWEWPDPSEDVTPEQVRAVQEAVAAGEWREHPTAKDFVGKPIAEALELDLAEPSVSARVKELQRSWVKDGVLKVVERKNAKRETKRFVEIGKKKLAA